MKRKIKVVNKLYSIVLTVVSTIFVLSSLLSVTSCKDQIQEDLLEHYEKENKKDQEDVTTRSIGDYDLYEKKVDIEDFKDVIVEDQETYQKHQSSLQYLLSINEFPSFKNKTLEEKIRLSDRLKDVSNYFEDYKNSDWLNTGIAMISYTDPVWYHKYNVQETKVVPFVEVFFKKLSNDEYKKDWLLLTPKQAHDLFSYDDRHEMFDKRSRKFENKYLRLEINLKSYCEITGVDSTFIKNCRVLTRSYFDMYQEQEYDKDVYYHYYYQFPFKDNYKDYQNSSLKCENINNLKHLIQPGAILFVYDGFVFNSNSDTINVFSYGHSIIVTDLWYDLPDQQDSRLITSKLDDPFGYQSLDKYKKCESLNFLDIPELRKDAFNDDIKLKDYLKRFVFIEAVRSKSENENVLINKKGKKEKGVIYTSGNDLNFRNKFEEYKIFSVSNLNNGYKYNHKDLIKNSIENAKSLIGTDYDIPNNNSDESLKHYCSGIILYSYINENTNPSLRLLLKNHSSKIVTQNWYMPRTLTSSPFVYTRTWYKK